MSGLVVVGAGLGIGIAVARLIGDLTAHQHVDAWAVNVVGAITTAAPVVPEVVV